jgi:hypothetical protein
MPAATIETMIEIWNNVARRDPVRIVVRADAKAQITGGNEGTVTSEAN